MDLLIGKDDIPDSLFNDIINDWQTCGIYVLWRKVWDLSSPLNIKRDNQEKFAGGKDGTLIARYRKPESYQPKVIELFDYKMNLVNRYIIKDGTDNLFFYVSQTDKLIVLTSDGYLMKYFSDREVSRNILFDDALIDCAEIWEKNIVFISRTQENELAVFHAPHYKDPRIIQKLPAEIGFVDCMKVIPPTDKNPLTILLTNREKLFLVNEKGVFPLIIEENHEIASFSISSDNSMIAFLCVAESSLDICVAKFADGSIQKILETVNLPEKRVIQFSWSASDLIVITYEDCVNVINTESYQLYELTKEVYPFSGNSLIFQSLNYSLVFTSGSLYKIQKVHPLICDLIEENSNSKQLVDAFLKRSSERAYKFNRNSILKNSIELCLSSSLETDSLCLSKLLLYSANFGRFYLNTPDDFHVQITQNIQKIRVCYTFLNDLNILISPLCLFDVINEKHILSRICNRNRFSLALKIADYLLMEKQFIVTQWVLSTANQTQNDMLALKFINSKYKANRELFDFQSIAKKLYKEGYVKLAKSVAELDESTMNVVPFFISCSMWREALIAAKNSCDTTLFINTFNKALENNFSEEIALDIIKEDITMYLNIAKLVPPSIYTIIRNLENNNAKSGATNKKSRMFGKKSQHNYIVTDNTKVYKRVIEDNLESFTPANSYKFLDIFKDSNWRFESATNEKLDEKRPKNLAMKEMILKLDFSQPNQIHDFVEQCTIKPTNNLLKNLFSTGSKSRYYAMVASVLAQENKWDCFLQLADISFKDYYKIYVMVAYYSFSPQHASDFIVRIPDQAKRKKLEELIKSPEDISDYLKRNKDFHYFA